MALIDNYTKNELERIVKDCSSMRELQRRLGYSSIGNNFKTIEDRLYKYSIDTSHFTGLAKNKINRNEDNVFCKNSTANQSTLRRWYHKRPEIEYKCSICGQLPIWNNKELTLTLDHINGDNRDDRLENLRWVCPNCDRQLETFGSKNISHKKYNQIQSTNYCIVCGKEIKTYGSYCRECFNIYKRKVIRPSKEELEKIIIDNKGNFTKIGKNFGVCDNTIRKWCKSYGLSIYSKDYK